MGLFGELKRKYPYLAQQVGLYGTILAVLICAYFFVRYYNNSQSVELTNPPADIIDRQNVRVALSSAYPPNISCPKMGDPKWKDIPIGDSGQKIGESGSLLCALACIYPIGEEGDITPADINARLMDAGAYAANDNLDWEKANAALPALRLEPYTKFDPSFAAAALNDGKSVLAKVRLKDNVAHWVSIYFASPEGYLAADPLTGEPVWLSEYGRVFTLVFASRAE